MMHPSNPVVLLAFGLLACAETSAPSVVSSPDTARSSVPLSDAPITFDAAAPSSGANVADTPPARFRACSTDSECVAVPRVGCCHNGWNEAVSASQKEAYARSFVCPEAHPVCAMFIVRDTREPRCDRSVHLCTLAPK